MCLRKKILYQHFLFFVLLMTASSLETFNFQLHVKNVKEKATKYSLKTN